MRSQVEKRCVLKDMRVDRERRGSIICPLPRNSKGPRRRTCQDESLDGTNAAGFKNSKSLTPERMKGMGDFSPSQILAVTMCIYFAPSRPLRIELLRWLSRSTLNPT